MISITVDVDGEAGLPPGDHSLSARSERTYGIARGLPRILDVLAEFEAAATFYVPGITAERHPDLLQALAGHEIAHHGHTHRSPATLAVDEQRAEIEDGLAALGTVRGYRAPAWELTEATLALLPAYGFEWDSSLMGDDRPYLIERLVELPVHWALDDAPHFAHTTDATGLLTTWLAELAAAAGEGRHTTITCHPEILGRAHRIDVLRRVLDAATVPCVRHGEIARSLLAA